VGVAAANGGGGGPNTKPSHTPGSSSPPPPPAWGDAQAIADDWPTLIPASPDETGPNGQTCQVGELVDDSYSDGFISCDYPDGTYLEVLSYPDATSRDARANTVTGLGTSSGSWRAANGTDGGVVAVDDTTPWRWWTMDSHPYYAMYASHDGVTSDELRSWWWYTLLDEQLGEIPSTGL
jgi:hypothetical protein